MPRGAVYAVYIGVEGERVGPAGEPGTMTDYSRQMERQLTRQLATLDLAPDRPLLICDADEVLFRFIDTFSRYLRGHGFYYDWTTLSLTGNVRRSDDDRTAGAYEVRRMIDDFFSEHTECLPIVEEAPATLAALRDEGVQVVVLSNLPLAQHRARTRALEAAGMRYPLVVNSGPKGPTVRALSERVAHTAAFVDDIPDHHDSVARHAGHVFRIHFTDNARLRALQRPVTSAHAEANDWRELGGLLRDRLLGSPGTKSGSGDWPV